MHVALGKITLHLPANRSLKGKRKVVQSLGAQVRQRFNIAFAEVADQDLWQRVTLGWAGISDEVRHLQRLQSEILNYLQTAAGQFEIVQQEQTILRVF